MIADLRYRSFMPTACHSNTVNCPRWKLIDKIRHILQIVSAKHIPAGNFDQNRILFAHCFTNRDQNSSWKSHSRITVSAPRISSLIYKR